MSMAVKNNTIKFTLALKICKIRSNKVYIISFVTFIYYELFARMLPVNILNIIYFF